MTLLHLSLLAAAVAAGPQVEVSTLAGETRRGELVSLDAAAVTVKTDGSEAKLPLAELLGVRFTAPAPPKRLDRGLALVSFRDGTNFRTAKTTATGRQASFADGPLGSFSVPRTAVLSLRFDADRGVDDAWQKLLDRPRKRDLLVIKKKGEVVVLDFLEGIVAGIGEQEVRFLLDGDEIPVPLEKVFGVIYADRKADDAKPLCEIVLHDGGRLLAASLLWEPDAARATLSAGGMVTIPHEAVGELDFSLGKVRYLSQMEPRENTFVDFYGEESETVRALYKVRRDKNPDGDPLRLGNKTYARGLSIHSKTTLVYRINTDYRRFQAVAGIDRALAQNGLGDVRLVISDRDTKKVLFEADVRAGDEPRPIDVDVSNVRDLEILVDYGGDLSFSDWLDLADARVTK